MAKKIDDVLPERNRADSILFNAFNHVYIHPRRQFKFADRYLSDFPRFKTSLKNFGRAATGTIEQGDGDGAAYGSIERNGPGHIME